MDETENWESFANSIWETVNWTMCTGQFVCHSHVCRLRNLGFFMETPDVAAAAQVTNHKNHLAAISIAVNLYLP